MLFLIIPREGYTEYLMKRAQEFSRGRAEVKLLKKEEDALDPELYTFFVLKGYRKEAEILNDLRASSGLPEAMIVEVPKPSFKQIFIKNKVRARIAHILSEKPLHGYEIYKKYRQLFGKINPRLIYYHLEKGVELGIFEVVKVEEAFGEFSWGRASTRKYYKLVRKR